jgi:hypothetical protein
MQWIHAGTFLAYFIAEIWSYTQLKIVYYFPNQQKKIPNWKLQNKNIEKQNVKSLKIRASSLLLFLNVWRCCPRHWFITAKFKSWIFAQFLIKHRWNSQFHGYGSCFQNPGKKTWHVCPYFMRMPLVQVLMWKSWILI